MQQHADILIVGTGAAGLMAGIHAAQGASKGTKVVLLDGSKRIGTKILVAGGGRCNVTHDVVHVEDYTGPSKHTIKAVLDSFPVAQTVEFFKNLGVHLKLEDTGKLFPTTDRARTVLEALVGAVESAGAQILTEHRVTHVAKADGGFALETSQGPWTCSRLIITTGGKALPSSGSDGGGYALVQTLGHSITDTWPGLVPLTITKNHWITEMKGITFEGELRLEGPPNKVLHKQAGSILFTHFGLSGPAPMDISRHLRANAKAQPKLLLSFLPGMDLNKADALLAQLAAKRPKALWPTLLHEELRLTSQLADRLGTLDTPALPAGQCPREARRALAQTLTGLVIPVTGDRGYEYAEVTAGGVPLVEVNSKTMASRACENLFLAGEILDCDGRIGGYNFQWAWCTGRLAGLSVSSFTR